MKALLRPVRPRQSTETVELIARTANGKVTMRLPNGRIYAVDRFRLYDPANRSARLTDATLDALPWQGKGLDPVTPAEPLPDLAGLEL